MAVQVLYQGLLLSHDARMRAADNAALFVELELPMPVGSSLELVGSGTRTTVRVTRVHEGLGAGMVLAPVDAAATSQLLKDASVAAPAPAASQVPPNVLPSVVADAAPVGAIKDAPTRLVLEAVAAAAAPEPAAPEPAAPESTPSDGPTEDTGTGSKRKQRGRGRKTVIGH